MAPCKANGAVGSLLFLHGFFRVFSCWPLVSLVLVCVRSCFCGEGGSFFLSCIGVHHVSGCCMHAHWLLFSPPRLGPLSQLCLRAFHFLSVSQCPVLPSGFIPRRRERERMSVVTPTDGRKHCSLRATRFFITQNSFPRVTRALWMALNCVLSRRMYCTYILYGTARTVRARAGETPVNQAVRP